MLFALTPFWSTGLCPTKEEFPFAPGVKRGFSADLNLAGASPEAHEQAKPLGHHLMTSELLSGPLSKETSGV